MSISLCVTYLVCNIANRGFYTIFGSTVVVTYVDSKGSYTVMVAEEDWAMQLEQRRARAFFHPNATLLLCRTQTRTLDKNGLCLILTGLNFCWCVCFIRAFVLFFSFPFPNAECEKKADPWQGEPSPDRASPRLREAEAFHLLGTCFRNPSEARKFSRKSKRTFLSLWLLLRFFCGP